jgi:hypothetical protein
MKHRVGPRAKANAEARSKVWPILMQRTKGRCELCGTDQRLEWAHCMGRPGSGYALGAWANDADLTTLLCGADVSKGQRGCHATVDGGFDHDMEAEVKKAAAERLSARIPNYQFSLPLKTQNEVDYWADEIRGMVRELESKGVQPIA